MGFDAKTIRQVVKLRSMDASDRVEMELLLETYKRALNLVDPEVENAFEE